MKLPDQFLGQMSLLTVIVGKMIAVAHPIKFFLGIMTGVLLGGVGPVILAFDPENRIGLGMSAGHWSLYIAIGMIVWIAPTILRKTTLSEENKTYIDLIETLVERSNLTQTDKRQFYRSMATKALEDFRPLENHDRAMKKISEEVRAGQDNKDG